MARPVMENFGRRPHGAGWPLAATALLVAGLAAELLSAEPKVAIASRAMQPGELLVVTVVAPADAAAVDVVAFGTTVPAEPIGGGRWRALAGIDLDQPPGRAVIGAIVRTPAGVQHIDERIVVRPKTFRTRRLAVDPAFVNPPDALRTRIEQESALLRHVYSASAPRPLWSVPFVRPVPGAANSRFGTRSVFNGEPRNAHGGADFLSGAGTPIRAPNAGRIVLARNLYFSGNTVIIDHGGGLFSMLAHLSRCDVREGEPVARGAIVGLVGATGRVTGPHLHWALRVGDARVDPLSALALLGGPRRVAPRTVRH